MKINILAVAVVCMFVSHMANAACTITYKACTDSTVGATGTKPANSTVANGQKTFTPAANTCVKTGYVFSHYLATVSNYTYANDGVAKPGVTYTIPFNGTYTCSNTTTVTLTPQWVAANTAVPTSKAYVDTNLAGKQPAFTGDANGANKLMLYSGTTNGVVSSRDIVTTLGTPNSTTGDYSDTTSDSVPTRGAVNTGVNRKQNTINGTANWVTTYTGTEGSVDSKPIYNNTDKYGDALIEAGTLNTAIADAVNSEFTRVDENGDPDTNGALWRLNTVDNLVSLVTVTRLNPAPNGTGMCYHGISDEDNANGGCDTAYYNALPRGQWRVIFDYGNVDGNAVCSNVAPDMAGQGNVPGATKQGTIGGQWDAWVAGNRPTSLSDGYLNCYCQMTSPAVSPWVFSRKSGSAGICAFDCAPYCADYVRNDARFRGTVFDWVAQ